MARADLHAMPADAEILFLDQPSCQPLRTDVPAAAGALAWRAWRRSPLRIAVLTALGLSLGLGASVRAQVVSPNQPLAIEGLPPEPCPLLVPRNDYAAQPLRILPSQVAAKNAIGCLSPADAAVYGPDGCPIKLCSASQGTVPLSP